MDCWEAQSTAWKRGRGEIACGQHNKRNRNGMTQVSQSDIDTSAKIRASGAGSHASDDKQKGQAGFLTQHAPPVTGPMRAAALRKICSPRSSPERLCMSHPALVATSLAISATPVQPEAPISAPRAARHAARAATAALSASRRHL